MPEQDRIDEINTNVFSFVNRLVPYVGSNENTVNSNENLRGDGTEMIFDLGVIDNFDLNPFNPIDGKLTSKYTTIDGRIIGLDENSFKDFALLIESILQLQQFNSKCDFNFLIENAFDWLVNIYVNNKAEMLLIDYLSLKMEEECKEYSLYFRIHGISIEDEFMVGNSKIVFITEQRIDEFCHRLTAQEKVLNMEEIKKNYEIMKGVNIRVSITSTSENAKRLALHEAELAMDVLKCFFAGYSLHQYHAVPDMEHRKMNLQRHFYWAFVDGFVPKGPNFQNFGGFIALPIDNKFVAEAKARGLDIFSNFIKRKYADPLYYEIICVIQRFAGIVSTPNNYDKVAKAVSLLEGCILERPNKDKGKGEGKIKKMILPKLTTKQLPLFEKAIRKAYEVRNAYVHNSTEIQLNEQDLWVLLEIIRVFTISLINLHQSGKRQFEDIQAFFLTN